MADESIALKLAGAAGADPPVRLIVSAVTVAEFADARGMLVPVGSGWGGIELLSLVLIAPGRRKSLLRRSEAVTPEAFGAGIAHLLADVNPGLWLSVESTLPPGHPAEGYIKRLLLH